MSAQPKLMSDIEGLAHQVDPLSRRGFFLAASAATAAGYTLAAGPVRADAIQTDSTGLTVGEAKASASSELSPSRPTTTSAKASISPKSRRSRS